MKHTDAIMLALITVTCLAFLTYAYWCTGWSFWLN